MDIKLRHPQILGGTGSLLDSDLFDGYNSYDFVKKSETYSFQNNIGNSDLVVSQREARKLTLDNSSFQVSQSGNNPYVKLFLSGRVTNTNPSDYLLGDPTGSWYLGSEWSNGSRNATAFIKSSGVQTGSSTTDLPILRIESSGDIELYSGRNLNISNLGTYWLDSRNENATPNLYLNGATYNSNGWGFDIDNTSKDLKIFYNSLVDGSDNLILPANGSRPLWYNNQLAFRKEFEWSVKAMHIDSLYAGKNGYVPAGSTVPTKITTEEFIDHIRNIYDFGPNVEPYYILVSSNQYANPIITNTGVGDINLANADILVVNGNKDWNYTITVTTSDNNQLTPDPTPVKNTIITVNAEDRTLTWVDYSHGSQLYMTVPQLSIVDQVVTTSNISVESWLPGVYDVTLARENYWLETVTIGKTVSGVMYRIESTESKTTMNEFRLVNNVLYWYMPQAENWEFRCNGVLTQNNQSGRYGLLTNDFFDVGEIYEVAAYNPSPTEHPTVIKANILVSLDTDGKRVFYNRRSCHKTFRC